LLSTVFFTGAFATDRFSIPPHSWEKRMPAVCFIYSMKRFFIFNWWQFCSSSELKAEQNDSAGRIKTPYF